MTILNINKFYFIKGGAERFFFELGKLLTAKDHRVIPFAMKHKDNLATPFEKYFVSEIQTEKIKFSWQGIRTVTRYFWSIEARRKIKKIIKIERPQLAILHNIYHQISPSILSVLKKNNITTVLVAHDYGLLSPNYTMFKGGKIFDKVGRHNYFWCIINRCVKNSFWASLVCSLELWFHNSVLHIYQKNIDFILAPSKFMAEMFIKAGWPKEKIIHLPYFINSKEYGNITDGIMKKYILYFGRLSEEKGIGTLIEAMKNLPEIELKIVGDGPEFKNYARCVAGHALSNIRLLGRKDGAELWNLVVGSKFIVVPSEWYENYPLSILEAGILGIPALVSEIGGLPEMVPDNDQNFLFEKGNSKELAEKIKFLWQRDDLTKSAGEKMKNFVLENNNSEQYYQKLLELLD